MVLAILCAACLRSTHLSVDPGVTFAAHREGSGLVLDHLEGPSGAEIAPPGWLHRPSEPLYGLRAGGHTTAAFWLSSTGAVDVRTTDSTEAAIAAAVEPAWENNTIRLTLRPAGRAPFRTDVFVLADGRASFTRAAQTVLDLRGTYRADIRDASGAPAGWLRVRIGPYLPASRIYDGVLPKSLSPDLGVAAAIALDSEVDWIEDHTVNVYRDGRTGPLDQSVPFGKDR